MEEGFSRWKLPASLVAFFIAVALIAGALSGAIVALLLDGQNGGSTGRSSDLNDRIAEITTMALPSVVTIVNEISPSPALPQGGVGGGAGVVINERGLVLTNEHIVGLPGKLSVILNDGEIRSATLISDDAPFTDLAVIRIASGGLRALPLGNSDALVPGQTVIAIGSPDIDYQNSVSVGVVSGLQRRKHLGDIWREGLIQTDAAINVGNSGGPLMSLTGEVVGLVTFRDIGTEEPLFGISFAIASNVIKPILAAIIDRGKYPRPYFGVDHQDIDGELLQTINPGIDHGALIRRVIDGSPAQAAGLRPGDVVLRLGRTDIDEENTFLNALASVGVGERVPVQFWRAGRVFEASLETTAR